MPDQLNCFLQVKSRGIQACNRLPSTGTCTWLSKILNLGTTHQHLQEASHNLLIQQTTKTVVTRPHLTCSVVKSESVQRPDRIIGPQIHKPTKQQFILELFQQQSHNADSIERLQQRDAQLLLRKNNGRPSAA